MLACVVALSHSLRPSNLCSVRLLRSEIACGGRASFADERAPCWPGPSPSLNKRPIAILAPVRRAIGARSTTNTDAYPRHFCARSISLASQGHFDSSVPVRPFLDLIVFAARTGISPFALPVLPVHHSSCEVSPSFSGPRFLVYPAWPVERTFLGALPGPLRPFTGHRIALSTT